ncbi:MAG: carbohydrate binding family 9 domain-containing protein [Flavobacteriaceae bacterium]|nr:carbohydrate binding family 9 domain-containing protein [Flavobacteriaceae bacterium]
MKKSKCIAVAFILLGMQAFAQQDSTTTAKRTYETKMIQGAHPPSIDGLLQDDAWDLVNWTGDFLQRQPNEKDQPTYQTRFKVLYDAKYLYIGIQCFDEEPAKIAKRLTRRDEFDGDWIEVNIDSYNDKRTGFSFNVNAAGVKGDEFISRNGENWDDSWNPIYDVKTTVDDKGWNAEFRIPLSQLRFGKAENLEWGFQVQRLFFRNQESSVWQFIGQQEPGWVSHFGTLTGLRNIQPQKQLELQPYVVAGLETYEETPGDPFADGSDTILEGGLDGKIGITNDLTVDFTINPDFGQVEADPSAIALDGFQIFFNERRPFFVENKNIFDYRFSRSEAGNTFTRDNLFYSRRIGRSPQGSYDPKDGEYVDQPDNSTILGAAKFSGKTKNGWSIGILESVTKEEKAEIDLNGARRKYTVEPLTNYFVGRAQKDFNERNTFIGGIFTATNRNLPEHLQGIHQSAYTGGFDMQHNWKDREWQLNANLVVSHVKGSKEAIENTQESNRHLFNRVGQDYLNFDPNRTSLTGTGGNVNLAKYGKGLIFQSGFTWRSPELELNDIGFMRRADDMRHYHWMGYRWTKPFSIFRRLQINYNHWLAWDFGGNINTVHFNVNTNMIFKNNWSAGTGFNYGPHSYSNTALRGGPRLKGSDWISQWMWFNSDQSKRVFLYGNYNYSKGFQGERFRQNFSVGMTYQPWNNIQVSFNPYYGTNKHNLQYVTNIGWDGVAGADKTRYVNATIDQRTLSADFRLNYTINPNMSIQYWGQPFISRGRYTKFKYITNAEGANFNDRFLEYNANQLELVDGTYEIDENVDGTMDYSFGDPDFSYVEFRSNLVFRWEYIPGSEIFLVWSQGLSSSGDAQNGLFQDLDNEILGNQMSNIFLLKATYRFVF